MRWVVINNGGQSKAPGGEMKVKADDNARQRSLEKTKQETGNIHELESMEEEEILEKRKYWRDLETRETDGIPIESFFVRWRGGLAHLEKKQW